jgi:hypothetical protein
MILQTLDYLVFYFMLISIYSKYFTEKVLVTEIVSASFLAIISNLLMNIAMKRPKINKDKNPKIGDAA